MAVLRVARAGIHGRKDEGTGSVVGYRGDELRALPGVVIAEVGMAAQHGMAHKHEGQILAPNLLGWDFHRAETCHERLHGPALGGGDGLHGNVAAHGAAYAWIIAVELLVKVPAVLVKRDHLDKLGAYGKRGYGELIAHVDDHAAAVPALPRKQYALHAGEVAADYPYAVALVERGHVGREAEHGIVEHAGHDLHHAHFRIAHVEAIV